MEWDFENKHQFDCEWVIDLFEKMKVSLELAMIWLIVSPKNAIVVRLDLVCEGMLCEIVWLY